MKFKPNARLPWLSPKSARTQQEHRVQDYSERLRLPLADHVDEYTQKDLDATEGFLRYLLMLETEPTSTLARQLIGRGIELPEPDSLDEVAVAEKLEEVIQGLANLRTYLVHTDHLSDRELYEHLWCETLNEAEYEFDEGMGNYQTTIDLVGDGSVESEETYQRFYADELDRIWWQTEYPGHPMPDMEPAPHDRDRHLPKPSSF
ncbi:MAG: hypothetical protein DVB23_003370 [Verrucomicrobia bacterium]|jgi:uncharacterized protein YutE (UPF0331/DUF86 family)|nr:MAG: hypothetical protein DVB23_003370 [Verrucomicrobiota bacterium]